ncbi:hypothetical protein CRG98_048351 [Punica granatum]|uniref:Uncharacterized protein n=1 Tax=Punica granatum TaxID=22663 RepID=A0A2I0HHU8_PUNGR|nr:hypothetical protein CRG98_048351 [Punica granatum]
MQSRRDEIWKKSETLPALVVFFPSSSLPLRLVLLFFFISSSSPPPLILLLLLRNALDPSGNCRVHLRESFQLFFIGSSLLSLFSFACGCGDKLRHWTGFPNSFLNINKMVELIVGLTSATANVGVRTLYRILLSFWEA